MLALRLIWRRFFKPLLRFPVPVISAWLAFVFLLLEIHIPRGSELVHDYRFIKLFLECFSGIPLFIAFDIFCESRQADFAKRLGLYLLGFCILGLHYYTITPGMFDAETVFLSHYLIFFVCYHLLISVVAFYHSNEIDSFWQYNFFLFKRIVTSLLYSLTLFTGLASALWASDKLFSLHLNPDLYTDLGAGILLIFNTIFFLMGMPDDYQYFSSGKSFGKSVRIFVQYVLLPIIGIYILILYIYMFRIVMNRDLPNGYVCIPILVFAMVGILAYLLIYPIRHEKNYRSVFLFARYFFYVLLPLLSLYFIGIIKRIMPYGITEDRYLVFVLGIWLVILSAYIIRSRLDNIIIIPVSLFFILALSAIGPWGMFQFSVSNQVFRLEHLLQRNHLLDKGKLVNKSQTLTVDRHDAASIRSIFTYLNKRGEINRIHPWLEDADQLKLDSAIARNDLYYIHSIFPSLGSEESLPYAMHRYLVCEKHNLYSHSLPVNGFSTITQFNCSLEDDISEQADSTSLYGVFRQTMLYFLRQKDTVYQFSMEPVFQRVWKQFKQQQNASQETSNTLKVINARNQQLLVEADSMFIDSARCRVLISSLEFIENDTTQSLYRVEGYLLEKVFRNEK